MKSVAHWLFLVLAPCVLLPFPMAGQTRGPEPRIRPAPELAQPPGKAAQMEVSLVPLNITFTDPIDRLVTGLEKEKFRVFEDGRERGVTTFSGEDLPISIGIIFETRGSMSDKIYRQRKE